MNRNTIKSLFFLFTLALTSLGGCAQDMGTIDRVQPNAIKKDMLDGEWYFRNTVVDSPATGAHTFIGYMMPMERGVFEVQESTLFFYRTYEWAEDSQVIGFRSDKDTPLCRAAEAGEEVTAFDLEWCNPNVSPAQAGTATGLQKVQTRQAEVCGEMREVPVVVFRGAPVAAWSVTKHFDIIKSYNPTTGEKTNVLSENSTDNEWHERAFMRVDFSAQTADSVMAMDSMGANFTLFEGDSGPSDVQVRWEDFQGEATDNANDVTYFDFATDFVLQGLTTYLDGYGMIPYCWYYPWYTGGVFECTSERIRVRTSLLKVDKAYKGGKSDYVPMNFDDRHMGRFGYFRTERHNYSCNYGTTYSGATRLANRHRLWENYVQNEDGSLDYDQMDPKPIVYYLNEDHPREMIEASIGIAQDWAKAFDATVVGRGKSPGFPMFILCENSDAEAEAAIAADANATTACWSGSAEAYCQTYCEQMDRPHLNGDLRFNYLHAVTEPLQAGLYGYGPSSADPLTGEIISAGAYNYIAPMRMGARTAVDAIELAAGIKDWREAEQADDRVEANKIRRLKMNGEPHAPSLEQAKNIARHLVEPGAAQRLKVMGVNKSDRNPGPERLSLLQNSPELDALVGGDYVRHLFRDPRVGNGHALSPEEQKDFSVSNFAHQGGYLEKVKYYREMSEKNIYLAEFADGAIAGLARKYGKVYNDAVCAALNEADQSKLVIDMADFQGEDCTTRNVIGALAAKISLYDLTSPNAVYLPKALWWPTKDERIYFTQKTIKDAVQGIRDQVHQELWAAIYQGVAEHEVGHTIGLRHNFEGSTDVMNYFPEYWELRGQSVNGSWNPVGGPFAVETEDQTTAGMRQLQNSTVMDYGSKFNARFEGVGYYDQAAIKYAYGELVETFNQPPDLTGFTKYLEDPSDSDPAYLPNFLRGRDPMQQIFRTVHYTEIPKLFGGDHTKLTDRSDVGLETLATGTACELDDGSCGAGEYCEHYFHGDFCTPIGSVVPFRFCSDELAGYNATCDRWDEGANSYEIVRNAMNDYEEYWPFWGYMRDSLSFNPQNYSGRVYRAFKLGQRHYQYWVAEYARFNNDNWWADRHDGVPYEEDLNGGLTGAQSAYISFNTMAQVFGRPVASWYGLNTKTERYEPWSQIDRQYFDDTSFVWVGQEAGARSMYPTYDYTGQKSIVKSAGAIYDRLHAMEVLSDPGTLFYSYHPAEQGLRSVINYHTAFPTKMTELMGSIMVDDHARFGWCVQTNATIGGNYLAASKPVFAGPDARACDPAIGEQAMFPEPKYTFPTTKFRMPAMAGVYGMSMMSVAPDYSFIDLSHIYLQGHENQVTPPAGTEVATFEDPLSGKVYAAHKISDDLYNPAFELIQQANLAFADFENQEYYLSELQYLIGKLEVVRGLGSTFMMY